MIEIDYFKEFIKNINSGVDPRSVPCKQCGTNFIPEELNNNRQSFSHIKQVLSSQNICLSCKRNNKINEIL